MSPDRSVGLVVPGVGQEKNLGIQETVSKEACIAGLSDIAVKRVKEYCEVLSIDDGVDRDKLERTKDFFFNSGALGKVVSIFGDLLLENDQVTSRKQKLLGGYLSFVLERAVDQHLNNPENYVSHGFNHSLNVVKYTDQIMTAYPEIIDRVHWQYDVTPLQARFILRNVALLHDFGYPVSEAKKLNKASHSIIGADVIGRGQIELDGQMVPVGKVLSEILDDTSNGRIVSDLRNSIMLHNADKIDKTYDAKIKAKGGAEFLVDKENISKAFVALKELGYEVYDLSIRIDDADNSQKIRLDTLGSLLKSKDHPIDLINVPSISTETGEKYKGRSLGKKGESSILGLEYSVAALMEEPVKIIIRPTDNSDIAYDERFSGLQKNPLSRAFYHELGDERSYFYEDNKSIEMLFKKAKENGKLSDLREAVAMCISGIEAEREEDTLKSTGTLKDKAEGFADIKFNDFLIIWGEHLSRLDADECMSCWRGFVLDQIALRPEFKQIDQGTKSEIKKIAVKMNSSELKHFGGFEAIREVQITRKRVDVKVDEDIYDKLNKIRVREEVVSVDGQVSSIEMKVSEYQIWRMKLALGLGGLDMSIYVNGKKYGSD